LLYNLITEYIKNICIPITDYKEFKMGFDRKYDYKNYVYLRIPIMEYNEIMQGKKRLRKSDLESWREDYEYKQAERRAYARIANKKKITKTIKKLYRALEDYYAGLFKEDNKRLNPNRLAKLAGVNYRTASKFWKMHKLDDWLERFEKNPIDELRNFKLEELTPNYMGL
jgi:hypothetical protein